MLLNILRHVALVFIVVFVDDLLPCFGDAAIGMMLDEDVLFDDLTIIIVVLLDAFVPDGACFDSRRITAYGPLIILSPSLIVVHLTSEHVAGEEGNCPNESE